MWHVATNSIYVHTYRGIRLFNLFNEENCSGFEGIESECSNNNDQPIALSQVQRALAKPTIPTSLNTFKSL